MTRVPRILLKLVVALMMLGAMLGASAVAYVAILGIDEDPPDDSDMQVTWTEIPEADNAFTYINQAAQRLYWPDEREKAEPLYAMLSGEAWDDALAKDVLERNRESFALFEKGMACPQFQFPDPRESIPEMKAWPRLARVLSIRAAATFRRGKHQQAFDQACQIVRFGYRCENSRGTMPASLVGTGTKDVGGERIRQMLPQAKISPENLQHIAEEIRACESNGKDFADTIRVEYLLVSPKMREIGASLAAERALTAVNFLRPTHLLWRRFTYKPNESARLLLDVYRAEVQNATRPCSEISHLPPPIVLSEEGVLRWWQMAKAYAGGNAIGKSCVTLVVPGFEAMAQEACKYRVPTRATSVLVALKACKAKTGRLPQSLAELVPEYLSAVPVDDMDGKPLRYSPEEKALYSVGTNLADDGGSKDKDIVFEIDF
jgi:hypothetical protein